MSQPSDAASPTHADTAERHAVLFTGLVLQQANLAAACLGQVPHPETGRTEVNLEAASLFIDTLEMLEAKTRGNLAPDEARFLADTLTSLRLAFVQAAERPPASAAGSAQAAPTQAGTTPAGAPRTEAAASPPPPSTESAPRQEEGGSGKRFVKRY
jgi:hypothetical protein